LRNAMFIFTLSPVRLYNAALCCVLLLLCN
jgi:hypothetical protein